MTNDFCGMKGDEMDQFKELENYIIINAIVPTKLADIVGQKAREENIPFSKMAGQLILKGIEAERSEKAKGN